MQLPDQPKILIASSSYIQTLHRKEEVRMWARVTRALNLDLDILLVDSFSPIDPTKFVGDANTIARMSDNIGHPTIAGDGWGRDLCFAINYAAERSYDWIAFIESDVIFCQPVLPIIQKLCRIGVLAATPLSLNYQFIETGIMFLSVPYLIQSRFVERYNWAAHRAIFNCESHVEKLLHDELMILPLRGVRNDRDFHTQENLIESFPFGLDYLTHCRDFELYNILLRHNNLGDFCRVH